MFPIVIVDDSREDRELAERIFRQCNIINPIHLLASGPDCIDFLRKHYDSKSTDKPSPCFILVDLAMPLLSGVQTIAAINELLFVPSQWIVMLSGLTDVKQVREGYQLGARTFLTKPLRTEDVDYFIKCNGTAMIAGMTAEGCELRWAR